jgi:antitoxin VapB
MNISFIQGASMPITARLFTNGRSQAVRLPKGFRFEGVREVSLEREGEAIILRPVPRRSIETLMQSLSKFENMPDRDQPTHADRREAF